MPPPAPSFDATLSSMYRRRAVDALPSHLQQGCGIAVTKLKQLDVGVFRVDRPKAAPLVARVFSARRPREAALGDLAVLEQLKTAGFPAERPFGPEPLSVYDGQSVLVTAFVRAASKSTAPPGDPILALGALVGRLHGLAMPTGAANRPAGALHHFAEGTPADELRAARQWLRDIEARVAEADRDHLDVLYRALADCDDATGLPEAFVHADPVAKNTIFTEEGPVLVDWTGAGRGARLASLALVLRSSWAGPRFMRGYGTHVELTPEERDRAADVLMIRALVDLAFRVCREPSKVRQKVNRLPAVRNQTQALAAAALDATAAS